MSGLAVEDLLELWSSELRETKSRLQSLFTRPSVASSAAAFLDGLLGPERRKTGWMRAEERRWAIEDAFETAKTELGLEHK